MICLVFLDLAMHMASCNVNQDAKSGLLKVDFLDHMHMSSQQMLQLAAMELLQLAAMES